MDKKKISYNEIKLLNKDLNFYPTPGKYNKTNYENNIQNFTRKIELQAHFKTTEVFNKNDGNFHIKNSTNKQWTPKEKRDTVEIFTEAFKSESQNQEHIKKFPKNNLTKNEIEALKDPRIRNNIIITQADKAGAVVIIDLDYYINEANPQLNKKEFYKEIPNDPTELLRKKTAM